MNERSLLAGLLAAVGGVAVWVQVGTPASLLARPHWPDLSRGVDVVGIEGAAYPRYATGADRVRVRMDGAPMRIVSQFWSVDEYLYSLVEPERVVGVSETAYLQASSNVLPLVEHYRPVIAIEPEHVLRARPDLVITPESTRWEIGGLIRQAGVPVYRIDTRFETLQSIEDHIRLVGYLTGTDAEAEAERERFHAVIARAAARRPAGTRPPRVLGMGGSYSYGTQTLFHDILRVLGAENVAGTHGFTGYDRVTDEHIVRWDPDWIVAGADRGQAGSVRAALLARPAIAATAAARTGHVVVIENSVFLPMSPYTARLVDLLATTFYGNAHGD
ncbi:MAG: ABC transporter substrate-binding protein [Acidobacteriota bacterium]